MVFISTWAFGQIDYDTQYSNAKALFRDGKYNLAMESFKPLIPYAENNRYQEYGSFYYALSAYHQGYLAVAKDMLNQIKAVHPKWDKMNEVNFWLGRIHFSNRDYFQGLKMFAAISDKKFEKDIDAVKTTHISAIADLETLRMMHEDYPDDVLIGQTLALGLAKNTDEGDKAELETLVAKFKLDRSKFIPEAPPTLHKERYAVSLLLPFNISTLDASPGRKRNQVILDFYQGMQMAVDTLKQQGLQISLRAYDSERSIGKVLQLLETRELMFTDLIVGPLFPEENKVVQDFSMANKVNVIHPFSNSSDIIGLNPHAYLYQPSSETLGRKSAEFLAGHAKDKKCMVFYGPGKQDSVMAESFSRAAAAQGINVIFSQEVSSQDAQQIINILATATEFDEFKYPIEFTVKKDSIDCIFVASDDPLIYTKVISAVETRGDSILVVGSENWIEDNAIELEKYQNLRIALAAPNFMDPDKPQVRRFQKTFLLTHGREASTVARIGYEFMLFMGNQLRTNGVYFQEGLSKAGTLRGFLSEGFHYGPNRDNQLVPFIGMKNGDLVLIEKG